jgi:hypothetical protein
MKVLVKKLNIGIDRVLLLIGFVISLAALIFSIFTFISQGEKTQRLTGRHAAVVVEKGNA